MEDDEQGKKSKKLNKRQLHYDDDKILKKSKKKTKRDVTPDNSEVVESSFNDSKPNLPDWIDMTDSEDEFQKPKEKPKKKKKKKIQPEEPEDEPEHYDNAYNQIYASDDYEEEPQVKSENSPKKKKKTQQVEEPTVEKQDSSYEVEEQSFSSKKSKKQQKKQMKHSEPQENGDVTDAEQPPPPEAKKKVIKKPLEDVQQTSDKKKPKTLPKSPVNLFAKHEELLGDNEEPAEPPGHNAKEPSPKKPPTSATKTKPPTKAALAKQTLQQTSKDPAKKPVKKITKVPNAEQVTLGEEYKIKRVDEKCCNNCNEPVKIKTKTKVRDMGTQTADSAMLNGLKTRGRPQSTPRIKTVNPVSVEDRIIVPKQSSDDDEVYDVNNKGSKLTKEQIHQLRNMTISLKYPVLPQHEAETTAGSRPLTSAEKQNFETFETLRTGVWLREEDVILAKNWRKFCKRHDWDPQLTQPFIGWRHKGAFYIPKLEERQKFLRFLAHKLPHRSLYNVQMRFKNLFSTHRSDRYTPLEDEILMSKITDNPDLDKNGYLAELSEKLNRTRQSIWRRYRLLTK